jgi:hypothetical protein
VAIEKNTIQSLTDYLSEYLDGKFAPQADDALDEAYWREAKSQNSLAGYRKYLVNCRYGKYIEAAKLKAKTFRHHEGDQALEEDIEKERKLHPPATPGKPDEEKAWTDAKNMDEFISYQRFVQGFNSSTHLKEANQRMNDLDKMALDKIRIEEAATIGFEKSRLSKKDKIHLLEKIIKSCKRYFQGYPAANNNKHVKKIKDKAEIKLLNLVR